MLMALRETDPEAKGFLSEFTQGLAALGWTDGLGVFEEPMPSKWLDLLKEIAPGVKRATFMFNLETAPYINSFVSRRQPRLSR